MAVKIEPGPVQTVVCGGFWSTVIVAEGMRQLVAGGQPLIRRGPRLDLRSREFFCSESVRYDIAKRFDCVRVQPDFFNADSLRVETHALVMAPWADNEEMEFFQYFKPLNDSQLEYIMIWVIPPEFSDLPRVGVAMELPIETSLLFSSKYEAIFSAPNGVNWKISSLEGMNLTFNSKDEDNCLELTVDFPKEPQFSERFTQTMNFIL